MTPRLRMALAVAIGAGSSLVASASPPAGTDGRPQRYLVTAFVSAKQQSVVELLDARGRVERIVGGGPRVTLARLSPDGSMLAWSTQSRLYVERADGRGRRLLLSVPAGC